MNRRIHQSLRPSPDAVASTHDAGLVLLHVGHGRLFSMNRTAARVWRYVEQHLSEDAIAAAIGRDYGLPVDQARQHTGKLLDELCAQGLVISGTEA